MAKTKALNSFAVTAKLICVFVFAYAKSQFSHDAAHLYVHTAEDLNLLSRSSKDSDQITLVLIMS